MYCRVPKPHIPIYNKTLSNTNSHLSFLFSFSLTSPSSLCFLCPFLPYLIGFPCPCSSNLFMHTCLPALFVVVLALIFSGSIFFGGKLCGFDLPGFFELYLCQSSSVSLVSLEFLNFYVSNFMFVELIICLCA